MSKWRAKRRYEANRRFGERADDALVAISVLKARSEGIELGRDDEELRAKLEDGRDLLITVRDALADESGLDPFELAVAENIAEQRRGSTRRMIENLDAAAAELATASDDLEFYRGLQDAKNWLEAISGVATKTSQATVDQMRGKVADGTH
ncbi:hypothetical protein [Halorussus caseinilyticus]|uniref:Uncharacterized protein n=1 Tax=Halorussus caseinilyticus TaxID=3034025 RepID=A0ABD5WFY3_9EURY|nr:hypothetical protein [Halorussus sp. DT72]